MAVWTTPITFTSGSVLAALTMNQQVSQNMSLLATNVLTSDGTLSIMAQASTGDVLDFVGRMLCAYTTADILATPSGTQSISSKINFIVPPTETYLYEISGNINVGAQQLVVQMFNSAGASGSFYGGSYLGSNFNTFENSFAGGILLGAGANYTFIARGIFTAASSASTTLCLAWNLTSVSTSAGSPQCTFKQGSYAWAQRQK